MFYSIKRYISQWKHKNILIHVGKCGGSSLLRATELSDKVKITGRVHVAKPVFFKNQNYFIVARDPLTRCISAFNWRYKLVVIDGSQKSRFVGEYEILKKYGTLNDIAEKLYDNSGELNLAVIAEFETIHHLRESISFYLKDFLQVCSPSNIKGVFMQETLNNDIEFHLGVPSSEVTREKLNQRSEGNSLSPLGKRCLVRFLENDYNCLFLLSNLGHIKKSDMLSIYQNALSKS